MARLVQTGRSGGVWAVVTAQRPTSGAIPREIVAECEARIACRVNDPESGRAALGEDATRLGLHPERITRKQRGRAIVRGLDAQGRQP